MESGVSGSSPPWKNTTHNWAETVDADHLALVRRHPETHAPGGTTHLILEVLAYATDEAASTGTAGQCLVSLHPDGSVSVKDDGRGTDTRNDTSGRPIRKPIMATKDLRFFDSPDAQILADGWPRRGISVVAALSSWLIHTNLRRHGAWTQRYEYGIPVTGLTPIADRGDTGTRVHFLPTTDLRSHVEPSTLRELTGGWSQLGVDITVEAP